MNEEISLLKNEIHDKMLKKFGMVIDFDEMEESILTRMIANQADKQRDSDRDTRIEIRKLKVGRL